jgi:exo-beta-1,3-glucanase (GH17 family)
LLAPEVQCGTIRARWAYAAKLVVTLRTAVLTAAVALAALVAANARAAARVRCLPHPAALPAVARLREVLAHGRFVSYQPTSLSVVNGAIRPADPAGIRADLSVLRPYFDGLVTYGALHGAESIPAIAATLKFRALVIGVWDPADDAEVDAAIEAARRFPRLVVAVALGNEMLFSQRSDPATLAALIARVRARLPGTALSTTEPFHIYYAPAVSPLLGELDFLLVNVHPVFQPWFRDAPESAAAQFVVNVLNDLTPFACGPILVKETGVPTAPPAAGFSEARQAFFYRELRGRLSPNAARAFSYFAAFDAPWRAYDALAAPGAAPGVHPEEAHWGLYDAERRPKAAARELPPLSLPE